MSRKFHDIIERPPIELSGRFVEQPGAVRVYTPEEIASQNKALGATAPVIPEPEPVYKHPSILPQRTPTPETPMSTFADHWATLPPSDEMDAPEKPAAPPAPIEFRSYPKPNLGGRKPAVHVDPAEVAKLREQGLGNGRIAKHLGSNKSTIQRIAVKLGTTPKLSLEWIDARIAALQRIRTELIEEESSQV